MTRIPQHLIERDKQGVEALTYYGVSVTDLDRDGLLAALNLLARKAERLAQNYRSQNEIINLIHENYRSLSTR